MEEAYASIRDGLAALRASPLRLAVFGSEVHGFETHPPLLEDAVCGFERAHGITLPTEYRGFLIHVGNGGAGPGYGLFKLGELDHGWEDACWEEGKGFIGQLSEPFPHTELWVPDVDLEFASEEARQRWEEDYFSPAHVNGAIPICHWGCLYRDWLVVSGSEAGNVWSDGRVDLDGLRPFTQPGQPRVSFLGWYRSWLDRALAKQRH